MIDNTITVVEPVLSHNEEDTPIHCSIPEECDNVKKVIGDFFSFSRIWAM